MDISGQLARLSIKWDPLVLTDRPDVQIDVFKHSLSALDGLPPYPQARIIDLISNRLKKARTHPCLWVSVESPGSWFLEELKRLVKYRIPTLILPAGEVPRSTMEFEPHAVPHYDEQPEYPFTNRHYNSDSFGLKAGQMRVLRILARCRTAHTREITSLSGFSETYVRGLLKGLQGHKLVKWNKIGKYYGWEIGREGLRVAQRSWNIPKSVHFARYRHEFRYAGEKHRRVARMWRSWLEKAYRKVEIWECWTEVPVHYGIPDALAWGTHHGCEMLFWLEVDTGHNSRKVMERNYGRRLYDAHVHSRKWGIPIVFCLVSLPWVVKHFIGHIACSYPNLSVIGQDWRSFGMLPEYEMGGIHHGLWITRDPKRFKNRSGLPFDPGQYPSKPKKKEERMVKVGSNKPRFQDPSWIDDHEWERDQMDI